MRPRQRMVKQSSTLWGKEVTLERRARRAASAARRVSDDTNLCSGTPRCLEDEAAVVVLGFFRGLVCFFLTSRFSFDLATTTSFTTTAVATASSESESSAAAGGSLRFFEVRAGEAFFLRGDFFSAAATNRSSLPRGGMGWATTSAVATASTASSSLSESKCLPKDDDGGGGWVRVGGCSSSEELSSEEDMVYCYYLLLEIMVLTYVGHGYHCLANIDMEYALT